MFIYTFENSVRYYIFVFNKSSSSSSSYNTTISIKIDNNINIIIRGMYKTPNSNNIDFSDYICIYYYVKFLPEVVYIK